jgi:hypothetical protein
MAKDSFWFKHDNNARNDEKILELRANHGAEGYGVFWMIVETMAEDENGTIRLSNIGGLSLGYGVPKGRLLEIINCAIELGLFHKEEGGECKIFSNRMLNHKNDRKTLSEFGKTGANKRWGGNREAIANPMADKKREEKKRKEYRGIGFSEDGLKVKFDDGSEQDLGQGQRLRFREGGYLPHFIKKGIIE